MISPEDMLDHLRTRRSTRELASTPVARDAIVRVLAAATTAPSASNRQPWRFVTVTAPGVRAQITVAARTATEAIEAVVRRGPHAAEWGAYGDFFWQPLACAPVIIIPTVRELPDQVAGYLRGAGAAIDRIELPSAMRPERCATGAAVMAMLLQAHAEGLGAIWMAGPMVARTAIEAICGIAAPWQMLGAIALGHPASRPASQPAAPARKSVDDVTRWIEEPQP
jgi:nitroreductase